MLQSINFNIEFLHGISALEILQLQSRCVLFTMACSRAKRSRSRSGQCYLHPNIHIFMLRVTKFTSWTFHQIRHHIYKKQHYCSCSFSLFLNFSLGFPWEAKRILPINLFQLDKRVPSSKFLRVAWDFSPPDFHRVSHPWWRCTVTKTMDSCWQTDSSKKLVRDIRVCTSDFSDSNYKRRWLRGVPFDTQLRNLYDYSW